MQQGFQVKQEKNTQKSEMLPRGKKKLTSWLITVAAVELRRRPRKLHGRGRGLARKPWPGICIPSTPRGIFYHHLLHVAKDTAVVGGLWSQRPIQFTAGWPRAWAHKSTCTCCQAALGSVAAHHFGWDGLNRTRHREEKPGVSNWPCDARQQEEEEEEAAAATLWLQAWGTCPYVC